jgi:vacuolar-type H+-ATPase subunit E/Vma4
MKQTDENIKGLSNAVLSDVRGNAEQALTDAKGKAELIRRQAADQAAAERAQILAKASVEAERIRSQAIATTQLKARTQELESREALLNSVFEAAAEKVAAVQKSDDYEKTAQRLLREAVVQLGANVVKVHADQATGKFITHSLIGNLSRELNIKIHIDTPLAKGTGVVVETEDGHRQYDNTLETRLKRMRDTLRAPVYHILMGDAK